MPHHSASLTVAYEGPAVESGEMDVRDLAPALLGIGFLFEAANRQLYGDGARMGVRVRAVGKGSFEVDLNLVQSWAEWMTGLFTGPGMEALLNVKELVLGAGAAGAGLIGLVRWLRGNPPKSVKVGEREVELVNADGERGAVSVAVWKLYLDPRVQESLETVVAKPLSREDMDAIEFRDGETRVRIGRDEARWFEALPFVQTISETRARLGFTIVRVDFAEGRKWRLHDGAREHAVEIADEEFLARVDSGSERFGKGDMLVCDVVMRQVVSKGRLRLETVVEKVVEHRPAAVQLGFEDE